MPATLDYQSVSMLMEQAQRLVEQLGRLRSAISAEVRQTDLDASPAPSQLHVTLRELASVAEHTLRLSSGGDGSHIPREAGASLADGVHDSDADEHIAASPDTRVALSSEQTQSSNAPLRPLDSHHGVPDVIQELLEVQAGPRTQLPSARRLEDDGKPSSTNQKRSADNTAYTHGLKRLRIGRDTSHDQEEALEVERLIRKLRYHDKLYRAPTLGSNGHVLTTGIVRKVAAVQGGPAIRQFCSLIYETRSRESEPSLLQVKSHGIERALELSKSLGALTRKTLHGAFLIRLAQYHMAQAVDETKDGRLRADPSQIREAMEKFGWEPADKTKFFQYLRHGRQWRSVCGNLPGLLCLIPLRSEKPYSVAPTDYLTMKGDELDQFTALVGGSTFVARLNEACEMFQAIILGSAVDRMFRWEREHPGLRSWEDAMNEDILAAPLQPEEVCDENYIIPEDLQTWPKPPGWREQWPWPANPLAVVPSEQQCDLCDTAAGCSCVKERFRPRWAPRTKWYGGQGIGLQAVAGHEGDVAYAKGELIGRLCGRLLPAGTYAANSLWVVDMHRPDIPGCTNVCQIYVGGAASIFRNLNHCCQGSVRMRPVKASGTWAMGIEALRDIRHGEQLTVNFGRKFLRDQGIRCECEVCASPPARDGARKNMKQY